MIRRLREQRESACRIASFSFLSQSVINPRDRILGCDSPSRRCPSMTVCRRFSAALTSAGAVVLKAPPGAGKTTRVPPAMLDRRTCAAGNGRRAARSSCCSRGASRPGPPPRASPKSAAAAVGDEIGYQVRFERRSLARARGCSSAPKGCSSAACKTIRSWKTSRPSCSTSSTSGASTPIWPWR